MMNKLTTKMTLLAGLALVVTACGTLPPSANTDSADTSRAGQTQGGADPNSAPTGDANAPAPTGDTNTTPAPTNPNAMGDPNTAANPNTMGNPNTTDPNAKCADTWTNYAKAFVNGNCVGCHPTYTDYATVKADTQVQAQISNGSMPRGTALSAADKARILNWIDCKEPQ